MIVSSGVAMGRENEIVTFTGQGKQSKVSLGSWFESSASHPVCRRLFNEANNTFISLQKSHIDQASLTKFSLQYRSVLQACFQEMEEKSQLTEEDQELQEVLYKLELIWHLVEIMFIKEKPCGVVVSELLTWIQSHFSQCETDARECLQSELPYQHPKYWNAVYGFLLHGRLEDCRRLLREHNNCNSEAFQSCDEMLKKRPMLEDYAGQSIAELELRWDHWQGECQQRLFVKEFASYPDLEIVVRILCGDKTLMSELCETWYEMLVAVLFFTKPTTRFFELKSATQECIPLYMGSYPIDHTPMDSIIRAALEWDIHQVISESQSRLDNCWFTAHLADIIHHSDRSESTSGGSVSLREWLLLEYCNVLMSHDSLWQLAVDYLDYCPVFGRHYLRRYLLAMPIQNNKKGRKLIAVALERNLPDVVNSICKSRGKWMFSRGILGDCLAWAFKSADAAFASHLAEHFLQHYMEHGQFVTPDLLDNLGPMIAVTDNLVFLGKFKEFDKLYKEEKLKEAADVLVQLISSQMAPKYFALALFMNTIPLLERKETLLISADQTRELMACLEGLSSEELPKDQEQAIELALARNLAKATVLENN